jgi:hypothetical protein
MLFSFETSLSLIFNNKFCSSCFSEEDPSRDGPQPNQTGRRVEKNCSPTGPRDARFPVIIPRGSHPFPSRTRKLSLAGPMVLHGKLCGSVGRRRSKNQRPHSEMNVAFFCATFVRDIENSAAVRPNQARISAPCQFL